MCMPISGYSPGSIEDDCLVLVHEHTVLKMKADGLAEDEFFEVASFPKQVADGIAVTDLTGVLANDWAVIKRGRHVMGGGPDELHAAPVSLVIRSRPSEGRQKRVVNVDDRAPGLGQKIRAQDLHLPCQHQQLCVHLAQQFKLTQLDHSALVGLGLGGEGTGAGRRRQSRPGPDGWKQGP